MAKCDICGKGVHFGNNVSHSHRRSNRIWNSNIKSVKCKVNGAPKRMHVCTNCCKSYSSFFMPVFRIRIPSLTLHIPHL